MSEVEELSLDEAYAEPEVEPEITETVETEVTEVEAEAETTETEETTEEQTTSSEDSETKKDWTFSQAMDEREKRQAAVKRADTAEAKLAEFEKQDDITVFDEGYTEQERGKVQNEIRNNALNMSQAFAEEVYGEEKVAQAVEWMKNEGVKSAYVVDQFNTAKLPFHKAVKMFDDEQIRSDPDAYKAQLKAEILEELKSEQVTADETETETRKQKSIKPSLASKRSSGKASEATEDFEDILGD